MIAVTGTVVYCAACREPIDQTPTHEPVCWTHVDTGIVFCRIGHAVAVPDTGRLYDDTVADLDERYTLVPLGYDDRLTARQIQVLLDGDNEYEADAFAPIEQWESDCRWQASQDILHTLVDDQAWTLLADADLLETLRTQIQERDDSDVITDLLRNSHHALFRYDLTVDVPDHTVLAEDDERRRTLAQIADAAGLDATDPSVVARLTELIDNATYGGRLFVMWYGDPEAALTLAAPIAYYRDGSEVTDPHGTVTFTDAHLVVLDGWNGSGHDVPVDTITAVWAPRRVTIDAPHLGRGYSWHDIAGPVPSTYAGSHTVHCDQP
ncbi:MAG TPA: hypothetical protein VF892_17685 [Pseudonocardiaceae bacterium]